MNRLQLQHKEIPHDIPFYDQDGHKVHYTIKHEDEQNASYNDFYPIICQQDNTKKTLRLKNDGNEPDINQSKALLSCYKKFEQLFIEPNTNLLCYREPIQDTCRTEMKICVPLSLFLPLFSLAHTHSHSGHPGIFKTFENIRQYFFRPGRYKWLVYLIEDCIECQTSETKRLDLHEALLEQWGEL